MKITEIFDLYGQMLYAGYNNQNLQLIKLIIKYHQN